MQRGGRGEGENVSTVAGCPGAPTHGRAPGQRVGGDRKQQLRPGQDAKVKVLVGGGERVPHGGFGLGGRVPLVQRPPPFPLLHARPRLLWSQTMMQPRRTSTAGLADPASTTYKARPPGHHTGLAGSTVAYVMVSSMRLRSPRAHRSLLRSRRVSAAGAIVALVLVMSAASPTAASATAGQASHVCRRLGQVLDPAGRGARYL